jgi:hypothetical protein
MSGGFGQFDTAGGGSGTPMPLAIYDLVVVDADVKRDSSGEVIRDPKTDKARFRILVEVASGEFKGERIVRTCNVTYAPSQDGNYGPFAQFLQAATGIPCGDPRQREIGRDDLRGRVIRGLVKHARGYNNIAEFVFDGAPATAPTPRRDAAPPRAAAPPLDPDPKVARYQQQRAAAPITLEARFANVILPRRRQIEALARAKRVSDARLAAMIDDLAHGGMLDDDLVLQLIEALKVVQVA